MKQLEYVIYQKMPRSCSVVCRYGNLNRANSKCDDLNRTAESLGLETIYWVECEGSEWRQRCTN